MLTKTNLAQKRTFPWAPKNTDTLPAFESALPKGDQVVQGSISRAAVCAPAAPASELGHPRSLPHLLSAHPQTLKLIPVSNGAAAGE